MLASRHLLSQKINNMKTLIVFYSRTGVTKKLAQKLALELGADMEELIDKENRSGALGYLKSGRDARRKKLALLEPTRYNPADYEQVIIGTPVWANTMACAVRTYINEHKSEIKQIALFTTRGGESMDKANKYMTELSGLAPRAELSLTSKEVMRDMGQEKINEFISLVK